MSTICVFCGSRSGTNSCYAEAARELGETIATRGHTLIYGGGNIGLMGIVARSALNLGGTVVGVIPQFMAEREIALEETTELIVVGSMHQRKAIMAERADAFVALPGGYGTCDELFEILTWHQIGLHAKPITLLNVNNFFDPLLTWADHMAAEGFLQEKHRNYLRVAATVDEVLHMS